MQCRVLNRVIADLLSTGEESYLESYRASILSTEQGEATVRDLTVDHPKQQILIPTLERLTAQKIRIRREGHQLAPGNVRLGAGSGLAR